MKNSAQMSRDGELPVVAIVGRPNVGKSSLFNRIIGKRHAVVEKKEGTTRDRIESQVEMQNKNFILVDTGGFVRRNEDEIYNLVKKQIEKAFERSDIMLFMCDGENGPLPMDMELGSILRKSGKKIIPVVNKIDNEKRKENMLDFYELGLGEPRGISCLHNIGVKDLLDTVLEMIPESAKDGVKKVNPIKIAIVGRPNVGKSSFLNKVLGEERVVVHELPGTTRDSIDTYFEKNGLKFMLIDTAGIRHKRKVKKAVDVYSMMRARQAIDRSDIAFLLIDGVEGVAKDDAKILDYIKEEGKGCLIIVNKWDLVKGIEMQRYEAAILRRIPEAKKFPIKFVSAKTGRNVQEAFDLVKAVNTNLDLFIDEETLLEFLDEINPETVKIPRKIKPPRFYSMAQTRTFPKEFLVFVNNPGNVTGFHTSFIENRLRERFPLKGVPVRIIYKRRPKK